VRWVGVSITAERVAGLEITLMDMPDDQADRDVIYRVRYIMAIGIFLP
jgi:hypothetical protein